MLRLSQELSGQWVAPILLGLDECGGRFTPLQHHLEISPARLSDNLKKLTDAGFIRQLSPYERNHPLLPEYLLTDEGNLHREAAKKIRQAESDIGSGRLSAKAWNIPIMLALGLGHERFQEIRRKLPELTPRMLSIRLDELNAGRLVDKFVSEQPRPSFVYRLAPQATAPMHRLSAELTSLL